VEEEPKDEIEVLELIVSLPSVVDEDMEDGLVSLAS